MTTAGGVPGPLRVGMLAPPWVTVPPERYGGTEAVIDVLSRGLLAAGHEVVLFTTADSGCPVPKQWTYAVPPLPMGSVLPEIHHVQAGYDALLDCDVIHDHTIAGPVWAATLSERPPVLVTQHGEFSPEVCAVLAHLQHAVTVNAISHSQAAMARGVGVQAVVHHGLETGRFPVGAGEGGFAMYIGRCTPEKGLDTAIAIARGAGVPLVVVAKMREVVEQRYFTETIEPLLGDDITFLGEVPPPERNRLLAQACALINPISWPEPFGLVMAESLACGTPVIAYPAGAAPEIVDDGVTGFLCKSSEEAAQALRDVGQLDRDACRAAVQERFSAERMVADYVALYRLVIASGRGIPQPT
jgi:glycosyltransferase involved in cell wall biosynthesis